MRDDQTVLDAAEGLTGPGSSKPWAVLGLGLVLPVFLLAYAVKCWSVREASLPAIGNGSMLYGDSARWAALVVLAVALFIHGRSFWGGRGFRRTHQVISVLSCLLFIVSFFGAMVCSLAGV